MKIYLAAASQHQSLLKEFRKRFLKNGVDINSHWLDVDFGYPYSPGEIRRHALQDLKEIRESDAFVLFNPVAMHKKGTGGRHVEFGYAYALDKPIVYISQERENVFHSLPGVTFIHLVVENWDVLTEMVMKDLSRNVKLRPR